MSWLFGTTGQSFFEVWTIVHLCFWIFIGSCLWALKMNKWLAVSSALAAAGLWEVFERYAERKWPDKWLDPESWINSWVSDPLTALVGVLLIWWLLDHRKRRLSQKNGPSTGTT